MIKIQPSVKVPPTWTKLAYASLNGLLLGTPTFC